VRLIGGFFRTLVHHRIDTDEERLAWLIVIATIPVGAAGLAFEHAFRVLFAKPVAAAIFLAVNGAILLAGERYRHRTSPTTTAASGPSPAPDDHLMTIDAVAQHELAAVGMRGAFAIGAAQILALLAGISRGGVAMVGGLLRGLNHENAMRFSFMLSTPVILAAGLLKVPDLVGPLGNGIRGPVIAGSVAAAAASLFAVLFLARFFRTRTLAPFAIYCLFAGGISVIRFAAF